MDDAQVRIGSYETAFEAESLRGVLEAEGIRSWLEDANLEAVGPLQGYALAHIGVVVERESATRAAEIARRFEEEAAAAGTDADEGEKSEGKDRCVACNAEFPEYLERCPACGLSYS